VTDTTRLDIALVSRGLCESRTKAQRRIAQGDVALNGEVHTKPSTLVGTKDTLVLSGGQDFVGRGALKLAAAVAEWGLDPSGKVCVDIGASTGGFTEVLLRHGAKTVVSLDVGHDQLHPSLREDPRVVWRDGVNIRHVTAKWWEDLHQESPELIVVDVSFLSLKQVLSPAVRVWPSADWVALVKPQFEVGRTKISGGLSVNPDDHARVLEGILEHALDLGLHCRGIMVSPITGEVGNREYLCWLSPTAAENPPEWGAEIHDLTHP
jgi:23S rRNA (cytidine1920-2'-O)/16S rRNA (cytidine1409-2'-O)-methyltransferase